MSERNVRLQQHYVFDRASLAHLIRQAASAAGVDAEIVGEGSYFVKPFSHGQMEACLRAGIWDDSLLDGLYRMEQHMPGLGSELYVNVRVSNRDMQFYFLIYREQGRGGRFRRGCAFAKGKCFL